MGILTVKNAVRDKEIFGRENFVLGQADLHIAFSVNETFIYPLGVFLTSILENNKNQQLEIHVFVNSISEQNHVLLKELSCQYKVVIALYYINDEIFRGLNTIQFTIAAYYRFLIPAALQGFVDKFLYLDADMVCINSLERLKSIAFENKVACVVEDHKVSKETEPHLNLDGTAYFNTGMMYIDVEKWIGMRVSEKCLELLQTRSFEFRCFDQDALNIILEHHLKYVDSTWNFMCNLGERKFEQVKVVPRDTIIIHYIGFNKPWHLWCFHPLASYF